MVPRSGLQGQLFPARITKVSSTDVKTGLYREGL
jgi:hypothetical protein